MKKITYLILILLLFNCSGSDDNSNDNNNNNPNTTFLENYDRTSWLQENSTTYIRFINNLTVPIELWTEYTDCYDYDLINIIEDNLRITENLGNKLVLEYSESEGYSGTFTLTVTSNNLVLVDEYESPGDSGEEVINYSMSSINFDDVTICD